MQSPHQAAMAQTKDPSSSPPSPASSSSSSVSWLSYASAQAQELGASVAESSDAVLHSTRSYLTGIASSTSQFIPQGYLKTLLSAYGQYEDLFFGKLKEGLQIANDHPGVTYTLVGAVGILAMKRPRRLLLRYTIGRFQSEEAHYLSTEKKVQELRQSIELLKNESKKLQERTTFAEDELLRGRAKLKKVGIQISNLVTSICRTEKQAKGLMQNLRELPGRDVIVFRAQVASLAAAAEQQKDGLTKKISKIAGYGIPV